MKKPLIWIVAMSTAATIPSAAAACDLDGAPGFGGMHRFNPFAKAWQNPPALAHDQSAPSARTGKGKEASRTGDKASSRKTNSGDGAPPKREWETDVGNGPITATDMATFT